MRCKNAGSDYDENNIQWTCTASLPEEFKLGSTDVICEGYDYPEDPYILKGSCGVEYRLVLTNKGHAKYGKGRSGGWSPDDEDGRYDGPKPFGAKVAQALFWLAFIGVAAWIIYSAWIARQQGAADSGAIAGNRPGWGGGGGGGPRRLPTTILRHPTRFEQARLRLDYAWNAGLAAGFLDRCRRWCGGYVCCGSHAQQLGQSKPDHRRWQQMGRRRRRRME
jgi:hypothetical protein